MASKERIPKKKKRTLSHSKHLSVPLYKTDDIKFEVSRKILHIICGLLIILSIQFELLTPLILFEVFILLLCISLLSRKVWIPIWNFLIRKFERKEWKKSFPGRGLIYFVAGAVISLYLFPRNLALASIMIATFGDSSSCIFGILYRKITNKNHHKKLIFGTVGGFFAGLIGASFYIALPEAALASAAGLLAEFVEMDLNKSPLDDNIAVPLASATAVLILRKFL